MKRNLSIRRIIAAIIMIIVGFSAGSVTAQSVEYVGSALWTYAKDVEVVGDYAYCTYANGLIVFNIAEPSLPVLANHLMLPGWGQGIDIEGNCAFIAAHDGGLQITDISDHSDLRIAGEYQTQDTAKDVSISGTYAYIADYNAGLQIVNIADPGNPELLGHLDTPGQAVSVAIQGDYAYIAARTGGLQIINISDASNPVWAASVDTIGSAWDVVVRGNYAYLVVYSYGLYIIDISNPLDPSVAGSYETAGFARGVYVDSDYAYIADHMNLHIADISDPHNPFRVEIYHGRDHLESVKVSEDLAFAVGRIGGLEIVSVANPEEAILVGKYHAPEYVNDVFVDDGYAYIPDHPYLWILDNINSRNPTIAARFDTGTSVYASEVIIVDRYAYVTVTFPSILQIIDISNPSDPVLIGDLDIDSYFTSLFITDEYIYLGVSSFYYGEWTGIYVYHIDSPGNLVYAGELPTEEGPHDIDVVNGIAFIADGVRGLLIVDMMNPENPEIIGNYDTPNHAYDTFIKDEFAFVADGYAGLQIIDVSNPENPLPIGSFDTDGMASSVFVEGNYAYLAIPGSYGSRLQIIDVSDPVTPVLVVDHETPGIAFGLFVESNHVYVGDRYSLLVFYFDSETGVIEEIPHLPDQLSLSQNYPNPFNWSTSICYSLSQTGEVNLAIYNLVGQKVANLYSGVKQAGQHNFAWDASEFSSGIYFAWLKTHEGTKTIKMLLLR